jgi:hypothetical protein
MYGLLRAQVNVKVPRVNYQTLYRVKWLHDRAFAYLQASGAAALAKLNKIIEHSKRQKEVNCLQTTPKYGSRQLRRAFVTHSGWRCSNVDRCTRN